MSCNEQLLCCRDVHVAAPPPRRSVVAGLDAREWGQVSVAAGACRAPPCNPCAMQGGRARQARQARACSPGPLYQQVQATLDGALLGRGACKGWVRRAVVARAAGYSVIVCLYSALDMGTATHQVDLVCEPSGVPGSSVGRAIDSYNKSLLKSDLLVMGSSPISGALLFAGRCFFAGECCGQLAERTLAKQVGALLFYAWHGATAHATRM